MDDELEEIIDVNFEGVDVPLGLRMRFALDSYRCWFRNYFSKIGDYVYIF